MRLQQLYLAVLFLLLIVGSASSQYCGGTLEYIARDSKGKLIDPIDVRLLSSSMQDHQGRPVQGSIFTIVREQIGSTSLSPARKKAAAELGHEIRFTRSSSPFHNQNAGTIKKAQPVLNTFGIAMGCGIPLAEMELQYLGKIMRLTFRNVTEIDGFIDSLPFQEGNFEVDIKNAINEDLFSVPYEIRKNRGSGDLLLPNEREVLFAKHWRKVVAP